MKQPIISLHGSYFGNNYGDILLVKLFSEWIKEANPNIKLNLPLARFSKANDLPKGCTRSFINLIRSKALVFCGGGYFGEQPLHHTKWAIRNFFRYGIVGLVALIFHIPYVIIGVEFGPISTSWFRKFCIFLAKHADKVVVRNQQSKDFLLNQGVTKVELTVDGVLSLSDIIKPNEADGNNIIIHYKRSREDLSDFENLVGSIVKYNSDNVKNFKLSFISDSLSKTYNKELYKKTFEILERQGVVYHIYEYTNCDTLINIINDSSYVVTTKLHVGITAAALNKRVLSLWNHEKTPRLHKQINNEDYCYPVSVLADKEKVDSILSAFLQRGKYKLPDQIKSVSLENKNYLQEFLKSILN